MQDLINAYLNFIEHSRSTKTHATYKQALRTFIDIVGTDAELNKQTYIKFLRKTSDMNPSTQSICRSAVKGLYFYHADNDPSLSTSFFVQADKQYALRSPKRLPIFNKEGIEQIIEYCKTLKGNPAELRDRAFILLLADTGLRVSEACNMQVGDVDWLEQRAVVIGKGNKQAVVHLSNRAVEALRDYLTARCNPTRAYPLFIRHDKRVKDQIKQVDAGGMWRAVKRMAVMAGADPSTIRVHDFRHYFVTVVYASSRDIRLAQKLARHENIETTSRYAHLIDDAGEAYSEIFNK